MQTQLNLSDSNEIEPINRPVDLLLCPLHVAILGSLAIALASCDLAVAQDFADDAALFTEDFQAGVDRWEMVDPATWKLSATDANQTLEITARQSDYQPPHRSPLHIALIKDLEAASFEITFQVRSTKDTGNHRDCCVFFGYQDPTHFYYVHLGAKPDPASGQIMIVNEAPRTPLTKNEKRVPWTDDWHQVRLVRDYAAGTIAVYFDDMVTPIMSATDKTFGSGRIGIGSFDDMNEFDDIVIREI